MGASAGACVCAIVRLCFFWLSCGSRVEKQLFFFFSRGRFIRRALALGGGQPHRHKGPPAQEDRQGSPCQAWRPNNCLIKTFSARVAAWPLPVELPLLDLLFSPLFHLVLTPLFLLSFLRSLPPFSPQATPRASLMGNVLLDSVPS